MKFESLELCKPLLRSLKAAGYKRATPIQEKAIPKILGGRDLIGCAQTGTGKTAAFTLPTLHRLVKTSEQATGASRRRQRSGHRAIRALILAPTRELASQVGESFATYGKFTNVRHAVIYGGVAQGPQVRALKSGVDVLVATPGRLLDLIQQGFVDLAAVEVLILDEADMMLDMGFVYDLRKIVAQVPKHRQTLFFSATMPGEIRELANEWLRRPQEVKVTPVASTPNRVSQSVCFVDRQHKRATLTQFLNDTCRSRTLVFVRTKRGADHLARGLQRNGIEAVSIHGDKSQCKRRAAMRAFNSNKPPVLVATDLAARGLDFSDVSHVINYDMPDIPETYVHRIGRTARAGATGQALSFCARDEQRWLKGIEKLTGQSLTIQELPGQSGELTRADEQSKDKNNDTAKSSGEETNSPRRRSKRRKPRNRYRPGPKGSNPRSRKKKSQKRQTAQAS